MGNQKPHVHLLTTGGTIANPHYVDGYITGETLIEDIPEITDVADVTVSNVSSVGSSTLGPEIWFDLHAEIMAVAESDDPPDGFVVTQGSNSIEETGYFLSLTLDTEIPVAMAAAQRNHGLIGNDGDRNLLDAVKVATSEEARGRGVLITINDEIHSARDVSKIVSGRPDAWSSVNLGVLGLIDKRDNMKFYRETECRHYPDTEFDISEADASEFPSIEIVYAFHNSTPELVEAAGEIADGLVVAGFPTGSPKSEVDKRDQREAIEDLVDEEFPVVMTHRGVEGWPYPNESYIWGNTLRPQKAAILLALGLMETSDIAEIDRMFHEY